MSTGDTVLPFDIELVRAIKEFRQLIRETSIRRAAKLSGIGRGAVISIRDGARLQERTQRQLLGWYQKDGGRTIATFIPKRMIKHRQAIIDFCIKEVDTHKGRVELFLNSFVLPVYRDERFQGKK